MSKMTKVYKTNGKSLMVNEFQLGSLHKNKLSLKNPKNKTKNKPKKETEPEVAHEVEHDAEM